MDVDLNRYTLTYAPSLDHILPSPSHLHVKVKNTSAIPLRAAYLHGPYTLYTACYPSTFDPNSADKCVQEDGVPDFEPNLKAGGSWLSWLTVPEKIRETADKANVKRMTDGAIPTCTWIIEITSQVIFSTSATVHFELLVGNDEKSTELGFSALVGQTNATPGLLQDYQQEREMINSDSNIQSRGVYSKAVKLLLDDTESLWSKPALPEWNHDRKHAENGSYAKTDNITNPPENSERERLEANEENTVKKQISGKPRRIHLVVLTHGLHSNLGSDMLYIKESIDAAAKQARLDMRRRKKMSKSASLPVSNRESRVEREHVMIDTQPGKSSTAPLLGGQDEFDSGKDEDEEEIIVRGFSGNAVRTERGIQYLGKRLAKYVISLTYPDQLVAPVKKSVTKSLSRAFTGRQPPDMPAIQPPGTRSVKDVAYKVTSISFIAHSLGGLTQTYAIAYIEKHYPWFFQEIKPINFVTMATPFLGLSNENPTYVKFALDFGLVGKTGQDLGLVWRAPAMVRRLDAMIGGIGSEGQRAPKPSDPCAKPLLRILPNSPAQNVLKMFRNRTVYSNVVNDGIVPLRTSCLLFLDWSGLERVEKARRENGIVGTMAEWGWAELTGANSSSYRHLRDSRREDAKIQAEKGEGEGKLGIHQHKEQSIVPQPSENATRDDASIGGTIASDEQQSTDSYSEGFVDEENDAAKAGISSPVQSVNPLSSLLNFLRPSQPKSPTERSKPPRRNKSSKQSKIYKRSQTLNVDAGDMGSRSSDSVSEADPPATFRPNLVRGESALESPDNIFTPPRTSFFESAGDILNPPLPTNEFIINPASRPRTIFHDRVYHPEDIPPPRARKQVRHKKSNSSESNDTPPRSDTDNRCDQDRNRSTKSGMKIEEKIARAYHRDLSWRKVLVRLEPDAHNNICVRRMFSNAYGWPVIKHLVDTHFANSSLATTPDADETNQERAKPMEEGVGAHGEEVITTPRMTEFPRTNSELREAKDDVSDLAISQKSGMSSTTGRPRLSHQDSVQWDDALFDVTDDDSEVGEEGYLRSLEIPAPAPSPHGASNTHALHSPATVEKQPISSLSIAEPEKQDAKPSPAEVVRQKVDAGDLLVEPQPSTSLDDKPGKPLVLHGSTTNVGLGKSVEEQMARIEKQLKETEGGAGEPLTAKEGIDI